MPTKDELIKENAELKKQLNKVASKERCYRCNGTGEIWTYWDGDTYCPVCSGTGRV